jgi:hypothetical protein
MTETSIEIYTFYFKWIPLSRIPKKSILSVHLLFIFSSLLTLFTEKNMVVLSPAVEEILQDMTLFWTEETNKWYTERGIPYHRGYLLFGSPGKGVSF